jgi:peptide/nickel transport system substrate-binding protein
MIVTGRRLGRWLASGAAVAALLAAIPAFAQSTLKFAPHADLKVVDPITNTAAITLLHSYMIFDTLYAFDKDSRPQPQMAESHTISADGLTYTIKLRPNLKFHDGSPVTAKDVVASLKRWAARDSNGRAMTALGLELAAVDDRTLTLKLKEKWGLVFDSLAKLSANVAFIMREKEASTDPSTPITETIGSGPFTFEKAEWVPGSKVVYKKNAAYVPRSEPANFYSGGKQVKVDRVEWNYLPDSNTAAAALNTGEIDIYENPTLDLLPLLKRNKDIVIANHNPSGWISYMRPNHLHPPFNNVKARQALAHLVNQEDYMRSAVSSDPEYWKVCWAFMSCGSAMESEAGTEPYRKPDLAKAKALLAEAGYKGEKIVVFQPTDVQDLRDVATVTIARLREIGVNVDVQATDWATLSARRGKKELPTEGGWHIFNTRSLGVELSSALTNFAMAAPCDGRGWFGWNCDEATEKLRKEWAAETDLAKRKEIGAALQKRSAEVLPYIPVGQSFPPIAYRSNITGLVPVPIQVFWNAEKKG